MTKPESYLFAGGGSGGHLTPGLALAAEWRAMHADCRIAFVGSARPIECQMVQEAGYEHRVLTVESTQLLRTQPLRFAWRNWCAYRQAKRLLQAERPRAVIGLGGFASVPLVFAAIRHAVPTLILEQNTIPGRASRFLSRRAAAVCVTFPQSQSRLSKQAKVFVTGNPVRREIAALAMSDAGPRTSTGNNLLVLGGSQGASGLNQAVQRMVVESPQRWRALRFIHQTGVDRCQEIRDFYAKLELDHEVEPFFTDMARRYRESTLVISRAGATTLAELACAGCPAVLVPYPHAADNHQFHNAEHFRQAAAARIVLQTAQPEETARQLSQTITELLDDRPSTEAMARRMRSLAEPEAAANVVQVLQTLIAGRIK
ncbi:MAG TPA: undecaprenyldiphospho-muramoylpentapeptide beta-N-acetylglucosaminyltransferase [Planctomycetaceae bacterium]|nr:undecaprenyldiphospho-muramoylpentapeptide beta-N-acetylglucosaminyltransferase [Planctomycetaceae bacterium]